MGHMRQNAIYVGSVVAEHCVSTHICRPEQPTSFSDSNNDIYSVANSLRRPNVSNLAFRKKKPNGIEKQNARNRDSSLS